MKKVSKIMIVVLALACIVGAVFAFAACSRSRPATTTLLKSEHNRVPPDFSICRAVPT